MNQITYKDLISQIKCGSISSPIFTQEDLDQVKSCIPNAVNSPTQNVEIPIPQSTSCINDGVDKIKEIYLEQLSKQSLVIELSAIKAKVQEALDHYSFISKYYYSRVEFFNDTISKVEPFTSEYLYWSGEVERLTLLEQSDFTDYLSSVGLTLNSIKLNNLPSSPTLSIALDFYYIYSLNDSDFSKISENIENLLNYVDPGSYQSLLNLSYFQNYLNDRTVRLNAQSNQLSSKNGATLALSQSINSLSPLPNLASDFRSKLSKLCKSFSGQLVPYFYQNQNSVNGLMNVPSRTSAFSFGIVGLDSLTIGVPIINSDSSIKNVNKNINVLTDPNLPDKCFDPTIASFCTSISVNAPKSQSDYSKIPGDLYNGANDGYLGLYTKLKDPIQYLYTYQERGLTIDPNEIDPILSSIKDAPVSIKSNNKTLYIKNQQAYSDFFQNLETTLPEKIAYEINEVFPSIISKTLNSFIEYSKMEVADQFRKISGMSLKLARPTSYKAETSSIYSQGTFTYSSVDPVLSSLLSYYTQAYNDIQDIINKCNNSISVLEKNIKLNQLDKDSLTSKISQIDCFSSAKSNSTDCQDKVNPLLGSDPLILRTMDHIDSTMPNMTTPCYWDKFSDCLNRVSILPIPDLNSPVFRYYPVNVMLPTPIGITLLTIPQKWTPLFVLPTVLGTLVTFLAMPIAIIGIPLPSIFVLYIAPDGNKYLVFAPNLPILYSNPFSINYGFSKDNSNSSINSTGLSGPYSGSYLKGSLTIPLSEKAKESKSSRLAKILADEALGKNPQITNRAGTVIGQIDPTTYLEKYLSTYERAMNGADSIENDLDRQIEKFKRNINIQLEKLGPVNIPGVTYLKDQIRKARESALSAANSEEDLSKKRNDKSLARQLDQVGLSSKISAVLNDFNTYIDKIHLGNIKFPDDPTKLNPKLPDFFTGIMNIIERASTGNVNLDKNSKNLKVKLKRIASSINQKQLDFYSKVFNLNNQSEFNDFQKAMNSYLDLALNYLSGNISPIDSSGISGNVDKSNQLRKKRIQNALNFTVLSVTSPSLKLFDPNAPCCPVGPVQINGKPDPLVSAAIAVLKTLFEAVIEGLTIDSMKQLLGNEISSIGVNTVQIIFNTIIDSLPDITLPEKPDIVSIVKTIFVPIYSAMSIPQAPNPLGLVFPTQLDIPLDSIIKPLLKLCISYLLELIMNMLSNKNSLIYSNQTSENEIKELIDKIPCGNSEYATVTTTNSSNTVFIQLPNGFNLSLPKVPMIPLDLIGYFSLLTPTDLSTLIRKLIMSAIDGILLPLKELIDPILNLTKSLKDLSFNIVESANPFIQPIKLIMMAIQLQTPNSTKVRLANLDAIELIRASYIPLLTSTEHIVKEVAYLATLISCSLGGSTGIQAARLAANPFFNQDDLPPWERLTEKNPLFSIFLDELAWRTSLVSTGSLIFQTKTPGLYPSAWNPNVFTDPGAIYHSPS